MRPSILFGLGTLSLTKGQEAELEVEELKMLSVSLGVMRMDRVGNKHIRGMKRIRFFGIK